MPNPVNNERVKRLLQDRSGPSKEPGFDAFDEDRWRLLNRAENRERQRKKLKQPAFMSYSDLSKTKSSHRSYTGNGQPRSDLGIRPPTMFDYGDRTWLEERQQLHWENKKLRAPL